MKLSIVIPCFNEESIIGATTSSVINYTRQNHADWLLELILVDDGSKDGTAKVLKGLVESFPTVIKPILFPFNMGRGAAILAGIKNSTGDLVVVLDADLSYDTSHITKILGRLQSDPLIDAVVISPYMKGGVVLGVPGSRLVLSKLANFMLAGFFDDKLSTVTCCVRGYRGDLIRSLPLFEKGKALHLEILRKLELAGAKIVEVPGHLAWKDAKKRSRRGLGLSLINSASHHFQLGLLNRPTRLFKYLAVVLLIVASYETLNLLIVFGNFYSALPHGSWDFTLWKALSLTFKRSPHSVVIAALAWILGWQISLFLFQFKLMKLQHEELMRHLLALWKKN